jgi:hypothetical protein
MYNKSKNVWDITRFLINIFLFQAAILLPAQVVLQWQQDCF